VHSHSQYIARYALLTYPPISNAFTRTPNLHIAKTPRRCTQAIL
jgi:hypothetical protein